MRQAAPHGTLRKQGDGSLSLVEEIQARAVDRNEPVGNLLLRVKLAAAKLKLTDTLDWVDRELEGYGELPFYDMPRYRVAAGRLMQRTPSHGATPAHGDPKMVAAASTVYFREPVGALESLLQSESDRIAIGVDMPFAEMAAATGFKGSLEVHFSKNVIVGITGSVRKLVLDWAIKLEGEGILGEGVSFTMEEKAKAAHAAPSIQINNYGHLHQGDTHGHQNRTTVNGSDASTNSLSIDVFEQVQSAITNNVEQAADREVLLSLLKQMGKQKGSGGYRDLYNKFLIAAANHMTVLAPFLPALGAHLPG